jgi:hypothetical protein
LDSFQRYVRWYKTALIRALERSDGERTIHAFLKRHPQLLVTAFNYGWNHIFLVPEFQLGTTLRADFVLFGGYSGGWSVRFIELEPVGARLYLKNGTPSKELRLAMTQISDWREYIRVNESALRGELSRVMVSKNIYQIRHRTISRYLENHMRDPEDSVEWHAHIVIGRRENLTADEQRRRTRGHSFIDAEIATYDRLIDIAEKLDSAERDLIAHKRKLQREAISSEAMTLYGHRVLIPPREP